MQFGKKDAYLSNRYSPSALYSNECFLRISLAYFTFHVTINNFYYLIKFKYVSNYLLVVSMSHDKKKEILEFHFTKNH